MEEEEEWEQEEWEAGGLGADAPGFRDLPVLTEACGSPFHDRGRRPHLHGLSGGKAEAARPARAAHPFHPAGSASNRLPLSGFLFQVPLGPQVYPWPVARHVRSRALPGDCRELVYQQPGALPSVRETLSSRQDPQG